MFLAVKQTSRSRNPSPSNPSAKTGENQLSAQPRSKSKGEPDKREGARDRSPSPLIAQRKLGVGESPPKVFKKKAPAPSQDGSCEDVMKPPTDDVKKPLEQHRQVPRHTCIDTDKSFELKVSNQVSFAQERQPSKSEIVRKQVQQEGAPRQSREGPKPQDAIPRPQPKEPLKQSSSDDVPKRPPGQNVGQQPVTSWVSGKPESAPLQMSSAATSKSTPATLPATNIFPSGQPQTSSTTAGVKIPSRSASPSQSPPSTRMPVTKQIPHPTSTTGQSQTPKPKPEPTKIIPKFELSPATNSTNESDGMSSSSSTERLVGASEASPKALRPVNRIEDVNTIKRQPKGGWL